jgi:hypothetical protein
LGINTYLTLLGNFTYLDRSSSSLVAGQLWGLLDSRSAYTHSLVAEFIFALHRLAPDACSQVIVEAILHPHQHAQQMLQHKQQILCLLLHQQYNHHHVISGSRPVSFEAPPQLHLPNQPPQHRPHHSSTDSSSRPLLTISLPEADNVTVDEVDGYKRFSALWHMLGELYPQEQLLTNALLLMMDALDDR